RGRTGSGKTYAFLLALLTRLAASLVPRRPGRPRALILAPTRELATQIAAAAAPLAEALGLRTLAVFGGVPAGPQIRALRTGVDVLVACPGRLADHLAAAPGRTLVFARTKRGARTLTRQLVAAGVAASELHGNLGQNARTRSLAAFAEGSVRTLVATDIAARGIHVDDVALVVHADP